MQEILPVALGMLIGLAAANLSKSGWRLALGVAACLLTGATVSAMNGELTQGGWLVFVSVDSLLVWLGAATAVAGSHSLRAAVQALGKG